MYFCQKMQKIQGRCCIEPGDTLYHREWNEEMWAVLEEISSLSRYLQSLLVLTSVKPQDIFRN